MTKKKGTKSTKVNRPPKNHPSKESPKAAKSIERLGVPVSKLLTSKRKKDPNRAIKDRIRRKEKKASKNYEDIQARSGRNTKGKKS